MTATGPDFRTLFDTMAVPYAVMDRDFRYVALNTLVEDLVGRPRDEMVGKNLFELFPEIEERQAVIETAFTAAFDGTPTSMAEVPYSLAVPGKAGEKREIWWTFHCHPIPGRDGQVDFIGFHAENITRDVHARELKDSIAAELQHRVKNTLSLVQTIAHQTADSYDSVDAFIDTFDDRIVSLSQTHALLTGTNWDGLTFDALLNAQLASHANLFGDRIVMEGPALLLSSSEAQAFSMALHELTTNAMKHGALSGRDGNILIHWRLLDGDGYEVVWEETGLNDLEFPTREGFGTVILNRILPAQVGGNANHRFTPDSHVYKISVAKRR
jgi:PAS domain S-box-containing protein